MPRMCSHGEWMQMIVDCSQGMGVPCPAGKHYGPVPEGACCSECVDDEGETSSPSVFPTSSPSASPSASPTIDPCAWWNYGRRRNLLSWGGPRGGGEEGGGPRRPAAPAAYIYVSPSLL